MLKINTLDLYNHDATKAFIYDILVENRQLRTAAEQADSRADMWWRDYQAQKDRADKLEEVADSLAAERDAALTGNNEEGAST